MSLKNKVAIVTGGNSGIGMAIVLELAKQGANIVIDYVAHPEATEALEKQVRDLGDCAIGVKADVSQVSELQNLFDTAVKEYGRVDIMGDMTRFDAERLRQLVANHARYTGSTRAREILENWEEFRPKFRKIMPVEYRRALTELFAKGKPTQKLKAAGE